MIVRKSKKEAEGGEVGKLRLRMIGSLYDTCIVWNVHLLGLIFVGISSSRWLSESILQL